MLGINKATVFFCSLVLCFCLFSFSMYFYTLVTQGHVVFVIWHDCIIFPEKVLVYKLQSAGETRILCQGRQTCLAFWWWASSAFRLVLYHVGQPRHPKCPWLCTSKAFVLTASYLFGSSFIQLTSRSARYSILRLYRMETQKKGDQETNGSSSANTDRRNAKGTWLKHALLLCWKTFPCLFLSFTVLRKTWRNQRIRNPLR